MTDETEAVARAMCANHHKGDEDGWPFYEQDATVAITALDKHRIERAGEVEKLLLALKWMVHDEMRGLIPDTTAHEAANTIAALRTELARAEERGVQMGIEVAAAAVESEHLDDPATADDDAYDAALIHAAEAIRALDAEAIAKGIITADTLSELAAADAVLLDLPARRVEDWTQNFTRGDSDGDDGA